MRSPCTALASTRSTLQRLRETSLVRWPPRRHSPARPADPAQLGASEIALVAVPIRGNSEPTATLTAQPRQPSPLPVLPSPRPWARQRADDSAAGQLPPGMLVAGSARTPTRTSWAHYKIFEHGTAVEDIVWFTSRMSGRKIPDL